MLSTEVSSPAPVWPRVSTPLLSTVAARSTPLPVAVLGAGPGRSGGRGQAHRTRPAVRRAGGQRARRREPARLRACPAVLALAVQRRPHDGEAAAAHRLAASRAERTAAGGRNRSARAAAVRATAAGRGRAAPAHAGRVGVPRGLRQGEEQRPARPRRSSSVPSATASRSSCAHARSSTAPAPGTRRTRWAQAACRPSANARPRGTVFYGIPDVLGVHRARYAGKKTLVVGAGHSAANALLALAELAKQVPGTQLVWSVRTPVLTRVFGGGDADALPARGALGSSLRRLRDTGALEFNAGLRITEIIQEGGKLVVAGVDGKGDHLRIDGVDEIICATGQRPDLSLTSELRVKLDPWLESNEALGPLIDPNEHSCGTVRPHGHRELSHPEPGLYTVGVKSYGRAPTFLMATGFEQVRSVVAAIAGDLEAANRVELDLPETGVCGVGETASDIDCGAGCGASAQPQDQLTTTSAAKSSGCGTSCGIPAKAPEPVDVVASGCCGGPAKADASACCVLDEHMKAQGAMGCGCSRDPDPSRGPRGTLLRLTWRSDAQARWPRWARRRHWPGRPRTTCRRCWRRRWRATWAYRRRRCSRRSRSHSSCRGCSVRGPVPPSTAGAVVRCSARPA